MVQGSLRRERFQAWALTFRQGPASLARDVLIAAGSAVFVFLVVYQGLSSRPRASQVTPYYQENAKILTGAIGGGGGGRPDSAQGQGEDAAGLEAARAALSEALGLA